MSEALKPDTVFANLQEILNTSEDIIISKGIEILWLKKVAENDAKGFAKIGNKILPIHATLYTNGELDVLIGKSLFTFSPETIMKVIGRGESEG